MGKRFLGMVHPVGLPTGLPRGLVRVGLLEARQSLGCPLEVPGDNDHLPERFSYLPITTPERFLVIGHVVWDEITRELAFNVVEGLFARSRRGGPLIFKLAGRDLDGDGLFYNVTSGQVLEFSKNQTLAEIQTARRIEGVPATRLYRMLMAEVVRDKDKWEKVFKPDPKPKQVKE